MLRPNTKFTFHHLQSATLILMAGTMAANGLSFIKSLLIAFYFGTSAYIDAYVLSLTPIRLIAGVITGAVQGALIPIYLQRSAEKSPSHAFSLFFSFSTYVMGALLMLAFGLVLGRRSIAAFLGQGFQASQLSCLNTLLVYSACLLALTLLNNLGICFLTAQKEFLSCALLPLVSGILSLLFLLGFHNYGVVSLLSGLILGMLAQNTLLLVTIRRFRPAQLSWLSLRHPDVQRVFRTMLPLLLGASFGHINVTVDQIMASALPEGSIAALNYAFKLHVMFTQLFITIVSQAALPFFAKYVAEKNFKEGEALFRTTVKRMLTILFPITIGVMVLGKPCVRLLFERGAFSPHSTSATASAWMAYTLGLPFQAVRDLSSKMFHAFQENTILMYVQAGSIGLNILLNVIFMRLWGHVGIALSTSVSYAMTTGILLHFLKKTFHQYG